ncbi:MAG TPA: hypothetical protein ENM98_01310 [Halothiobacillaceae bacterium]|nr:hypothetical protein [Halothiobacillaceae bacterium]
MENTTLKLIFSIGSVVEEFAVLLLETDVDPAGILAERIWWRLEQLVIIYEGKKLIITISIGI